MPESHSAPEVELTYWFVGEIDLNALLRQQLKSCPSRLLADLCSHRAGA